MVHNEFEESYAGRYGGSASAYADSGSYVHNNNNNTNNSDWAQIAETTLPLRASKLAAANQGANGNQFLQASIDIRSRQISNKVIIVNLVSVLVNLLLAIIAFYFSFANNSTSMSAFATDCVLDFISGAIVLWRYHGDLNSVYMHAREQIACIYLGALFVLSSLGIMIKAVSDVTPSGGSEFAGPEAEESAQGSTELVILAVAATIACSVLTVFKCSLYKTLRDNSILLDVVNTLISTVFATSIVMSQALISVNPSFWYLDPILSVVLAVFMFGIGIKVIHENFNVLKPINFNCNNTNSSNHSQSGNYQNIDNDYNSHQKRTGNHYLSSNLSNLPIHRRDFKTSYSTITFE